MNKKIKTILLDFPINRVFLENSNVSEYCPICYSSQYKKYYFKKKFPFFYTKIYCLNDECENSENKS